jgi:VWFA-related protein
MAGPIDLESKLQAVIKAAVRTEVRIDSLDSRGLAQSSLAGNGTMDASAPGNRTVPSVIRHVPSPNRGGTLLSDMDHEASSVAQQNSSGIEQLAQSTGGVYFRDSNDMPKQLRTALADGREYYLLAYIPKNRLRDGKFRKIAVVVADRKLHVRAKFGYWAEAAPE